MRRRFSRRRRNESGEERSPLDAGQWLGRIHEAGLSKAPLEAVPVEGVPDWFAVVGRSTAAEGEDAPAANQLLAFSPQSGGDALLAALAAASRDADSAFEGELIALAPQWNAAALRQLSLVRPNGLDVQAQSAAALADANRSVTREPQGPLVGVSADQVAAHLASAADRALFARAAAALDGLAGKHGGAIRGRGRQLELIVMARRAAALHARDHGVFLETILPQRSETRLDEEELAGTLDKLEGHLRRRLNDRRVRDGEEGLRGRVVRLVASARSLRNVQAWPLGIADPDVIDGLAVDGEGCPVAIVARNEVDLPTLGAVIDAAAQLRAALPALLNGAEPPLRLDSLRVVLAAERVPDAVRRVLANLEIESELFEIRSGARGPEISPLGSATPIERATSSAPATDAEDTPESELSGEALSEDGSDESRRGGRGRSRRRGRRGRGRSAARANDDESSSDESDSDSGESDRMESLSFFDLDDGRDDARSESRSGRREDDRSDGDSDEGSGGERRRRRGGRGRRRGRRGGSDRRVDASSSEDDESEGAAPPSERGERRERRRSDSEPIALSGAELDDEDVVDEDEIEPFVNEDVPDFDDVQVNYDEEDEDEGDGEETEWRIEREKRRLARKNKARKAAAARDDAQPEEPQRVARKRAALLIHADRDSLMAGVLLARDLRLLEGIWIYPQEDLMTFFRGVAPDLRDDTPIHVVGFTPSPAFEVLQTVSLYRDRLAWYDHREWAPEDLGALRNMLGEANLSLSPRAGSPLPAVLSVCSRRSRFSDKLVDLATGRFTQHDYERWGRLWWSKLGEISTERGDRRHDVDPLLVGRPSELARDAAKRPPPPPPPEVEVVAGRDYRIVYFAGYAMVIAEVEEGLDPYLVGRIARERYSATLSLAYVPGQELVILGGDDSGSKRSLDTGAVAEHLSQKISGVTVLADDDHVARMHVAGLQSDDSRLETVIAEIAMGRSILEG